MTRWWMAGGVLGLALAGPSLAAEADAQSIVDAQFAIGGNHAKVRASGAKGTCVKGTLTPAPEAAGLSKAPHFAKPVPVTARFSMGGSNPGISDKTKPVTRGFAMRFTDEAAGDLTLVFISAPVFGAKNPEQLLENIKVRLPGPDGKQNAEAIKAFVDANPEVTRQAAWLNGRPIPASFAGTDYWGVHPYTLTNAAGKPTVAKLKAVAVAGQLGLSDAELAQKGTSFYADELTERLKAGPVAFDLVAILPEPGDVMNDVTATTPEQDRKTVTLGRIAVTALELAATCDGNTFDPVVQVPDGISGPVDDPIFAMRSPTYAISLTRRAQ